MKTRCNAREALPVLVAAALAGDRAGRASTLAATTPGVIVLAADAASAPRLVGAADGTVSHEAVTPRAVGARLTAAQRDRPAELRDVPISTKAAGIAGCPVDVNAER